MPENTTSLSKQIETVCKYAYNTSFEEFKDFAGEILDLRFVSEPYCRELFNKMRGNFIDFYCNLDDGTKERFVKVALAKYGKA